MNGLFVWCIKVSPALLHWTLATTLVALVLSGDKMRMVRAVHLRGSEAIDLSDAGKSITRNLNFVEACFGATPENLARIKVGKIGVCGSSLRAALGHVSYSFVRRDLSPQGVIDGHEGGGIFEGVGPTQQPYGDLVPGDRVVAMATSGCGVCRGCVRGCPNICRKRNMLGFHRHGLMAPVCDLEPELLLKAHANLSETDLAVVQPLSTVLNLLERLIPSISRGPLCNLDAIVSGPGIIGYMAAELLKSMGMRVAICGLERHLKGRLQIAASRGFHPIAVGAARGTLRQQLADGMYHAVDGGRFGDPHEDGCVDVFIECSGDPAALANAPEATANGGTIGIIGTYPTAVDDFKATTAVRAQHTMVTSIGSAAPHYEDAMRTLQNGGFEAAPYVQVFPATEAENAYRAGMLKTVCKPVIDWTSTF